VRRRRGRRAAAALSLLAGWLAAAAAEPLIPPLPAPVSNNAAARVRAGEGGYLLSFLGLGAGKTWRDTSVAVYRLRLGDASWQRVADVPGPGGRLAATAVGVGSEAIVIGGYTVAEDGTEVSVNLVHRFDPERGEFRSAAPMPVAVDDAVSFVYRDRYVYLVSGWHDDHNVALVQVYDADADRWFQATPFPGQPVFGHAGGIVGGMAVICDGVGVQRAPDGGRRFAAVAGCYLGIIDPGDPARVDWRKIPHHGGPATYRMAATGSERLGMVVFAGGSDNPYNYDGVGYDGRPSSPSDRVFAYRTGSGAWVELGSLPVPSMDHRGLLELGERFAIVGGMGPGQAVTEAVAVFGPVERR
jgi:hypothetical protein